MLYLLGSIILTSWLILSFKLIEKFSINTFQAIVFNYITCVITGSFVNQGFPLNVNIIETPWFSWACVMGAIFISLFNLIGFTAQKIGIAVTSVANKLSLVIPFIFSIYLYHEQSAIIKIIGVVVALIAVVLTCYPKQDNRSVAGKPMAPLLFLMPVILFIGSGLLDTMIKFVEQRFLNDSNNNDYLITAFAAAAVIGIVILCVQLLRKKQQLSWKAIIAGIAVGIPNYFSLWCLIQVLKLFQGNSSAIIPINNMGIVLFSAVMAWILFNEKLSLINWAGIILSLCAISMIAFG